MNIKLCIFDLDGTLADTVTSIAVCGNKVLEELGFPGRPEEEYNHFAGDGAAVLVQRFLKASIGNDEKEDILFQKALTLYMELFKDYCTYKIKLFPGILEMLEALKAKGIKIAVLSNKPHPMAVEVVDSLFGKNYFDFVQGQTVKIPKKPSPLGAIKICSEVGIPWRVDNSSGNMSVSPETCMYFGDTNTDMQTGLAANMFTVGVTWGFRSREELLENGAMTIIDNPSEILELLNR